MAPIADTTSDDVAPTPRASVPDRPSTPDDPTSGDTPVQIGAPRRTPATPGAWRRRLLVTVVFTVALLAMLRPDPATFTTNVPGDLGDGVLIGALMEWNAYALTHGLNPFYANFFWPEPLTLAYSESMLTLTPVYATFRALGAGWATALNLTLMAQLFLSLVATYVLCRRLTGRTDASVIGALAFTFSSFTMVHAFGHLQLAMLGVIPLSFLCVMNLFEKRRGWPWAIGLGLCFTVLVGSALYYAAVLSVALLVLVAGRVLIAPRDVGRRQLGNLLIAAVVAVTLSTPMLLPYIQLHDDSRSRDLSDFLALDHEDFLTPGFENYAFTLLGIGEGSVLSEVTIEHRRFPGVVPVLLAVIGIGATVGAVVTARAGAARRRGHTDHLDPPLAADRPETEFDPVTARRWLLLFGVSEIVVLSLSFGPHILWVKGPFAYLHDHVPGFDGLRVPSRFAVFGILAIALFAAAGWAWVAPRISTRLGRAGVAVVTGVIAALILAEQAVPVKSVPLDVSDERLAVYRALDDAPDGNAVELPVVVPAVEIQYWAFVEAPRMLYNSIGMNRRFNGYSGYTPREYSDRGQLLNTFPSARSLKELRGLDIRYVVLHTGESSGFRQYTQSEAQLIVGNLPPGATATRHGDSWLVDLGTTDG